MNRRPPQTSQQRFPIPPVRQNLPPKPNYNYKSQYYSNQQPDFSPRQFPLSQPSSRETQPPIRPPYDQPKPLLPLRRPVNQQPRPYPNDKERFEPEPMDTSSTTITKYQNLPHNIQHYCHEYELQAESYDFGEYQSPNYPKDPDYLEQPEEYLQQTIPDTAPENFRKSASNLNLEK
ncbi:glutenin, low molecular weight subunit-like [Anoplophora glabripennis]|uniref:glutenin, low molecular weight subunit-like n=1 Tax=Anoplophora glabripennis TaxID=217634 RepID=UPI0008752166|nr:glutenin, low molecular weight subunit-like [Anoplophora glabripennis]